MKENGRRTSLMWDMIAGRYTGLTQKDERTYALIVEKMLPYLTRKSTVLDLSSGTGVIIMNIATKVSSITAVDASPNMVSICRTKASERNIKNLSCVQGDVFTLPDTNYDVILLANTLHFERNPHAYLTKARHLCKDNGFILVTSDCLGEPFPGANTPLFLQKSLSVTGIIPRMHFFTVSSLIDLFSSCGLEHIESAVIDSAPIHLFAAFRKE